MKQKRGPVIITFGNDLTGKVLTKKLQSDYHLIHVDDLSQFYEIKKKWGETLYSVIHLSDDKNKTESLMKILDREFDVGQLVFKSTISVYDTSSTMPLTEESHLREENCEAEDIVVRMSRRIPFIILRSASVYNEFGGSPLIVKEILGINEMKLSSFIFPGDKNAKKPLIHVDDLTDVIQALLQKRDYKRHNLIFNIAEDKPMDIEEMRRLISKIIHKKEIPVFPVPKQFAAFLNHIEDLETNLEIDSSKIRKFLNWEPKHHVRNVLSEIVTNLQEYPGQWYRENHIERPQLVSVLKARFLKDVLTPN